MEGVGRGRTPRAKLQALVYDILPSTTAVFSYAIGSRKLSANEQFFVGAQTIVSLLQTTQIKQGMPFITANKVPESGAQSVTRLRPSLSGTKEGCRKPVLLVRRGRSAVERYLLQTPSIGLRHLR